MSLFNRDTRIFSFLVSSAHCILDYCDLNEHQVTLYDKLREKTSRSDEDHRTHSSSCQYKFHSSKCPLKVTKINSTFINTTSTITFTTTLLFEVNCFLPCSTLNLYCWVFVFVLFLFSFYFPKGLPLRDSWLVLVLMGFLICVCVWVDVPGKPSRYNYSRGLFRAKSLTAQLVCENHQ